MEKRDELKQNVFSLMLKIMLHPAKPTIAEAIRHIRMILETTALPVSSIELCRFVWRFRANNRLVWIYLRDGHRALWRDMFLYDYKADPRLVRCVCGQSKWLEMVYNTEHTELPEERFSRVRSEIVDIVTSAGTKPNGNGE